MRLLVASLSFIITLGVVFAIDKNKTKDIDLAQNQLANILQTQNITSEITPTALPPSPKSSIKNTLASSDSSETSITPSTAPSATATLIAFSPTTLPTTASPSPASQSSPIPASPATAHIFYTSSSSNSTKYYCDTDSAWKKLSEKNLRSFPSEAELLSVYPNKTLSKPCK